MKASRVLAGTVLAGGLWVGAAFAQAPPAAPPAAANPAVAPGVDQPVAPGKPTFCERLDKAIDHCRRKCCKAPLGAMLNSITRPASALTGGIIPNFCPIKPSEEDTKKAGAEGAAAQALKDAVEAAARRKAVRLLGTFDCHWYPEAEAGLAAALRTDRSECVRLEAAIALNRGCCCTRLIVEALEDCVGGTDKLGPSENSPRVQAIASIALERCLQCPDAMAIEEAPPVINDQKDDNREEGPRRPPNEPGSAKPMNPPPPPPMPPLVPAGPVAKGSGKPSRELIQRARRTLTLAQARQSRGGVAQEPMPAGQRSLAGLANYVFSKPAAPVAAQTIMPPVAAPMNALSVARTPAPMHAPAAAPSAMPVMNEAAIQPVRPGQAGPAASIHQPPAAGQVATSAYRQIPMHAEPAKPHAIDPVVLRSLETLRDAEDPEVRNTAVRTLIACNWRECPEAATGLIYAARFDRHAGVRVACIRALGAMKAGTPEVMAGLRTLAGDSDEWIRQEAMQATKYLQNVQPTQTASAAVLQTPRPSR